MSLASRTQSTSAPFPSLTRSGSGKRNSVRREVIPYQWEALNDRIPGAEKSWCMHNFRLAGRIMAQYRQQGAQYTPQAYTYRGYDALPR